MAPPSLMAALSFGDRKTITTLWHFVICGSVLARFGLDMTSSGTSGRYGNHHGNHHNWCANRCGENKAWNRIGCGKNMRWLLHSVSVLRSCDGDSHRQLARFVRKREKNVRIVMNTDVLLHEMRRPVVESFVTITSIRGWKWPSNVNNRWRTFGPSLITDRSFIWVHYLQSKLINAGN